MSRKEGRKVLNSIEDSVEASLRRLDDDINKNKERLITEASHSNETLNTNTASITQKKN